MGEVYLARDTRLGRSVALKVLSDTFAEDPQRMTRFRREAQLLAALNHPNIASIYGVEEFDGQTALVLELVDGETLAEKIRRGPIPIAEALQIALQIAEAIEAAHEKNVIHRDLKPANVKITPEGKVKVLDFGLAKALGDESDGVPDPAESPTLSRAATAAGIILGTAGYMAPEQARGKPVDRRADIWAFGNLLFEMLTARRVFEGETVADTLAKVLERDPDWKNLPERTPPALRSLLRHCLTKNTKDRLQAIGDARTSIQELLADPNALEGETATATYPAWKKYLPWAVAPILLAAGLLWRSPAAAPSHAVVQFEYVLPDGQSLVHNFRHGVALSPDGNTMVFVANALNGAPAQSKLYIRRMDQWDAVAINGTEGALNPFFSADGQWVGFLQGGRIKKVPLAGGMPTVLTEQAMRSFGISWGANGSIVYAAGSGGGLSTVRDAGGESQEFTKLDQAAHEYSHRLPHFLPDGSGVLFTVLRYSDTAPDWKQAQVWVKSSKTGEQKLLLENAVDARYAGTGYIVFARQGKLFAVRFDLKTLTVSGPQVPVLDGVTHAEYGGSNDIVTGAAQFSVSGNGSLLFAPGSIEPPDARTLVWVDRSGKVSPVGTKPLAVYNFARVSRDGKSIVFSEYYVDKNIWLLDPVRETLDKQTSSGQNFNPILSPDGLRIAFRSDRDGPSSIYMKELSSSNVVRLTTGLADNPGSWTPDGKELAFNRREQTGNAINFDIHVLSVNEPGKVRLLLDSPAVEHSPEFSTDGKWLAYCSNKSGRTEIYVQAHLSPGKAVQVSTDGGLEPAWSRDGKELFYRNGSKMMAVRFSVSGGKFLPEKPSTLFEGQFATAQPRSYDVATDGRFLMMQTPPDKQNERSKAIFPSRLRFVLNWTDELQRLMNP